MPANHVKTVRDSRFEELDILIAEEKRHQQKRNNSPPLTEAEQAQLRIERAVRLRREADRRLRARELLVPDIRRIK